MTAFITSFILVSDKQPATDKIKPLSGQSYQGSEPEMKSLSVTDTANSSDLASPFTNWPMRRPLPANPILWQEPLRSSPWLYSRKKQ
jgi:hypothetical protein